MSIHSVSVEIGGRNMTFETGLMAKQADGAVVVRVGDSSVLVTAVTGGPARFDFLPLTVEYQDRNGAYGTIPGNYFKREGRSNERETLISRMIDRPIRPQFPKHYRNETQVIATVMSYDETSDTDVLAITGAAAALHISNAPLQRPILSERLVRLARFGTRQPETPDYAGAFRAIGPAAIKLGQTLATRPDLVGEEAARGLLSLQDSLPPVAFEKIAASIEASFERPWTDIYDSIEEVPVGAASIAQVHRAMTTDGRLVAVKVLRPGIREQFARDIALRHPVNAVATKGMRRTRAAGIDPPGHQPRMVASHHDPLTRRRFRNARRCACHLFAPVAIALHCLTLGAKPVDHQRICGTIQIRKRRGDRPGARAAYLQP